VVADRESFEAFYRDRLASVARACALVLLDRWVAEEVAAEAFARLWANWDRIEDTDHAGGYVFTTAMRLCAKRRQRSRKGSTSPVPDRAGRDEQEGAMVRDEVFAALARLPLRQRQAVVLRDWAGFGTAEVAHMMGARESTVRVHLARGRAALRGILTVEDRDR
jgi:RNA polymerase sigma-70 factor (ECF subfamily)